MAIRTNGTKWKLKQCNLKIDGPAWTKIWEQSAKDAMKIWNSAGSSFSFRADPTSKSHLAAYNLGRGNAWIALAQITPNLPKSNLTYCNVLVNLHYPFNPGHPLGKRAVPGASYHLETILAHEFGHLLWLDDDTSGANTMMKATIKLGEQRVLHIDDKAAIKLLYK